MNFLAHLSLTHQDAEWQMGNFLGDYTKGRPPKHYPIRVQQGIWLHRQIDMATDRHEAVKAMAARIKHRHGPYAGVVTDVVFDYYLYRNWAVLDLPNFASFCDKTYSNLLKQTDYLQPVLQDSVRNMVAHRWLGTYTSVAGILDVFRRMRPRFSQPTYLEGMADTLAEEDIFFNQAFLALFPDLIQVVKEFRGQS